MADYDKTVQSKYEVEHNKINCDNADVKVLSAGTFIMEKGMSCAKDCSLLADSASTLHVIGLDVSGACKIHAASASTIIVKGINCSGSCTLTAKHSSTIHVTGDFAQKPVIDKDWSSTVIVT